MLTQVNKYVSENYCFNSSRVNKVTLIITHLTSVTSIAPFGHYTGGSTQHWVTRSKNETVKRRISC